MGPFCCLHHSGQLERFKVQLKLLDKCLPHKVNPWIAYPTTCPSTRLHKKKKISKKVITVNT